MENLITCIMVLLGLFDKTSEYVKACSIKGWIHTGIQSLALKVMYTTEQAVLGHKGLRIKWPYFYVIPEGCTQG